MSGPPQGYYGEGGQPSGDPSQGQQQGDPYRGQQPADPYAQPPPAGDPYHAQPPPTTDPYAQQPPEPYAQQPQQQQAWPGQPQQGYWQQPPEQQRRSGSGTGAAIVGIFLVLLGLWFLFRDEIAFDLGSIWPALAVGLGVIMVIAAFIPRRSR